MQLFVFLWKYVWKLLGFGYMHENKIFFFWKRKLILKNFEIFFWIFKKKIRNVSEKTKYFNTGYISYSVNIQPNIMQNWWENMW